MAKANETQWTTQPRGVQTSEFWLTASTVVVMLLTSLKIIPSDDTTYVTSTLSTAVASTAALVTYIISRIKAKSQK